MAIQLVFNLLEQIVPQARSLSSEVQRLTKENVSCSLATRLTPTLDFWSHWRPVISSPVISSPVMELFASLQRQNFDKTRKGNNEIVRYIKGQAANRNCFNLNELKCSLNPKFFFGYGETLKHTQKESAKFPSF